MKTMKAICKATVLALFVSVSALAGDIAAPGAPSPTSTTIIAVSNDPKTAPVAASATVEFYLIANSLLTVISLL